MPGTHFPGTALPIIQAPMAGVQGSALAIAVCNAGGLGSLPCAMLGQDALAAELRAITAGTGKPYNVNFFCHRSPEPNPQAEARWRSALAPFYRELGIAAPDAPRAGGRQPFSHAAADVLEAFEPAVVSFHFGLPAPDLLARVRRWGAQVIATATTVAEARWLAERGVDAIIAQGLEAGGHRGHFLDPGLAGQTDTTTLLRQIVAAVGVPVIASGGIAEHADVSAALQAGAASVQVGTAYLLCPEATTSTVHRAAISAPEQANTALTNLFSGRLARGICNRLMRELGPVSTMAPEFPLAATAIAPLRAGFEARGSGDCSPLWAGERFRQCRAIPAAQLTRELAGAPLPLP
ncbi:NAD(P)H-dependent flavin oxidoreductase [Parahaliea mediterranea]|uniref:NAD(P)H-dependent flavin oxidoreductase n=1 Tax=Parahaliea mediterranea TaxID=651086 RepID=UPI000E2F2DD8|nr:nitronate monooxygenase [Parahaliea mediterranea]